jgi:hypothetical protein
MKPGNLVNRRFRYDLRPLNIVSAVLDHLPTDVLICGSAACALTVRLRTDTVDDARLEVLTGTGRRRSFSDEDKVRISQRS